VRRKKVKIRRKVFWKKIYHIIVLLQKKEKERKFFDNLLAKNYFIGNLKQDSTFRDL